MTEYMSAEGLKIRNKWLILLTLTSLVQVLLATFGEGGFSFQQFALALVVNLAIFLIVFFFVYKSASSITGQGALLL